MSEITLQFSNVYNLRETSEGLALGQIDICGVMHHVNLIRVTEDENGVQQAFGDEAQSMWDDVCQLYDFPYHTFQVPGLTGDWICIIHPGGA